MTSPAGRTIGLDFDNTIVSYEKVYRGLVEKHGAAVVPGKSAKNMLRDHFHRKGEADVFTRIQGEVYGAGLISAEAYPGFSSCLEELTADGWKVVVVSHRTKYPLAGPTHDLHQAARQFLETSGWLGEKIQEAYFEETKEAKLARIAHSGCSFFVDDLPEILAHPAFPAGCQPILFDPSSHAGKGVLPKRLQHWKELPALLDEGIQ